MLENGTTEAVRSTDPCHLPSLILLLQLATHLLDLSTYFVGLLRTYLRTVPSSLLRLPNHLADSHQVSFEPQKRSPSRSASPSDTDRSDKFSSTLQDQPEILTQNVTDSPPLPLSSPIIPLLTPEPRSLSNFLLSFTPPKSPDSKNVLEGPVIIYTNAIYPPGVPPGTSRVRICLHAGHSREDVDILMQGIVAWTELRMGEMWSKKQEWEQTMSDSGIKTWMKTRL